MIAVVRRRRVLALVLQLLLLQISILGGGMACARVDVARTAAVEPTGSAHHDGAHEHAPAHHATSDPVPEAPSAPTPHHGMPASHCAAMGACAALASESPTPLVASVTLQRGTLDTTAARRPRTVRPAPEPPPPRG